MCDICNSLFGHLSSCPEGETRSGVYCSCCESELEEGEIIATFPNGIVFCGDCLKDFDICDLLDNLDVENVLELCERFELCETTRVGRWQ